MLALRTAAIRRSARNATWMGSIALVLASWTGNAAPADVRQAAAPSPAAAAVGTRLASAPRPDPLRASMEGLSAAELKAFYGSCSQEGIERRLDGSDAIACSIGYDILLHRDFSGDFERFLAWSRSQDGRRPH